MMYITNFYFLAIVIMILTRAALLFPIIIKTPLISKTFRYTSSNKVVFRYGSHSQTNNNIHDNNYIHINNNNHNNNIVEVKKGNQIALSFYQFVNIDEPDIIVEKLKMSLNELDVKGTLLVSSEGYNGQFIIPLNVLDKFHSTIVSTAPTIFTKLDFNLGKIHNFDDDIDDNTNSDYNDYDNNRNDYNNNDKNKVPFPFKKLLVRRKHSILTDGLPATERMQVMDNGLDNGPELDADNWHEEISKIEQYDDTERPLLLDCRNTYESEMGTFSGSQPLPTNVFSESWQVLDKILEKQPKNKRILTFCTGGIRCEKVNTYIKKQGYNNIGRLKHGIIGYERWINNQSNNITSKFEGEIFLFDRRRLLENNENNNIKK